MEKTYRLKLGEKANIFHDPSSGVTVKKGKVVEVTLKQMRSPRIQKAMNGGFLVLASESTATTATKNPSETPTEKFQRLVNEGADDAKLAKAFKFDTLKSIALELDIEPEDDDTKEILVKAIKEELPVEGAEETEEETE